MPIAKTVHGVRTSKKGLQKKVSGWFGRHDFATPVRQWLWQTSFSTVKRDMVIAIDGGDLSQEFGGQGMEMGYDASQGVTDMGHTLLLAVNAYFSRWSVEVLYQDLKRVFSLERARVRTFKRLEDLVALCSLAHAALVHFPPSCRIAWDRLSKAMAVAHARHPSHHRSL